ncbi:hypothetical protein [Pseudanabaena mucicola]|nr:hypothetical protein [Pseudanabaena mucicola]
MSRKKQSLKLMNPNPSRVLRLFAETQDRLYDGDTIKKALSQIARHTKDKKVIENCEAIAELLQIEFDQAFVRNDVNQHFDAVKKLQNHGVWVKDKYKEVKPFLENCDPIWYRRLQEATDAQLDRLGQLVSLLSAVPDICDLNGNVIRPNDLVIYPSQDEEERPYEHYGIVRATHQGYSIAHFFTFETIRPQGRVAEVGLGYVYFSPYKSEWLFKERPESVSDSQIESRIDESRKKFIAAKDKLWNKLLYNCEHWAREMFYGEARSTQVENLRTKKST